MWIKLLMPSWSLSRNDNQRDDHTIGESAECQLLQSTSEHQRTQRWRCTRIVLSVGVWHICTQNLLWLFLSPKHSHRQNALSTWYQLLSILLQQHHFFSTWWDKNTEQLLLGDFLCIALHSNCSSFFTIQATWCSEYSCVSFYKYLAFLASNILIIWAFHPALAGAALERPPSSWAHYDCVPCHTCHTTVLPANERYMPGYVPKAILRAVLCKIMLYALLYWLQFPPTPPLQHGIHGAKIWYNARSNTCCQGGVQEKPYSSSSFTVHFFTTVLADWPFPPSFWNKTRCSLSMLHIPAVSHKCLLEHCTRHCDDA